MPVMRVRVDRQLLDRQIVDRRGRLVGKVDDVDLVVAGDGHVYLDTMLTGQIALGQRLGGVVGRLLVAVGHRFAHRSGGRALEIPFRLVTRVGSAVEVDADLDELPPYPAEQWLRRHLVSRIPGAGHAGG